MEPRASVAGGAAAVVALPSGQIEATAAVAQRIVALLARCEKLDAGRVLLLESHSQDLADTLRSLGFRGEQWAITASELSNLSNLSPTGASRGRHIIYDWLRAALAVTTPDADGVAAALPMTPLPDLGRFDAIVACDLLSRVPPTHLPTVLAWLGHLLDQRGLLVLDEASAPGSDHLAHLAPLEPLLAEHGFLQIADATVSPDARQPGGPPRLIAALQYRGVDECRQSGILRPVTRKDLDADADLTSDIVETYREVFGGDEWQEWARCTNPACGRHYSQRDTTLLLTAGRCVCGWPHPLEAYHHPDQVAAQLREELGGVQPSCCYIRRGPGAGVDAFVWGYVTTPERLASILIPDEQPLARRQFLEHLDSLCSRMHIPIAEARVYYQSQIGSLGQVRGLGLVRSLFHRVLQFAADQSTRIMVTRTLPRTSAYPLLLGLGLDILYRYDEPTDIEANIAPEESLARPVDQRVIFGGDIEQMLQMICSESDRRMALQIAHRLRDQSPDAVSSRHARPPRGNRWDRESGDDRASAG